MFCYTWIIVSTCWINSCFDSNGRPLNLLAISGCIKPIICCCGKKGCCCCCCGGIGGGTGGEIPLWRTWSKDRFLAFGGGTGGAMTCTGLPFITGCSDTNGKRLGSSFGFSILSNSLPSCCFGEFFSCFSGMSVVLSEAFLSMSSISTLGSGGFGFCSFWIEGKDLMPSCNLHYYCFRN